MCLVLVFEKSSNFSEPLLKFREIAKQYDKKRVRFLYLYEDIQVQFVNQLNVNNQSKVTLCADKELSLKVFF